ncbi:hypothetical protein Nepgr_008650 [Nepenthes gracilis]|uniref:Uncharacterized protein n=1 Tax=Nepenthes gracilis TaxID=150966 RepID=A0AAD3XJL1_NEPGR|nr:hypothetical protein Nepgr_008650 [Nepenthes gracilis]
MEPPRSVWASLWQFVHFLPFFIGLLLLATLKGIIFCPLNCLIMTTGNSAIILSLWPVHFFWTYNCVLRARQLGPILKLVLCPCIFVLLILWPVIGVVVSIVGGAAYGFLSPVFATFEAVGEGKTNELFHCIYDGTWSTVKGCFTIIRDFRDVCFHSYFSIMDDLQRQGSPDGKYYEIRVLYLPGAVVAGVLGISIDLPMILLIALFKSPYMLFRGWHRLFQDLIGREGPFLETICVPFAGLAILLWPLAVGGAVLGAVVSSIFLGAFAGVVAYQECSLWMGLCYVVAALAIFDEYSNDVLDMPEGTCFPRPYYRKDNPSQTQSGMLSSSSNSFQNPPSRSGSLKNFVVEMNALELLDRLFKECQFHGEKMVSEGLISLKDIEDAKSSKDSGGIVSIGLPAYCILQTLLQSAKANSVGILLSDNVTEITSTNRPKDTIFDWFLNPLLIIKDQIKAENLSEAEEEYLGQLVLLSGNPERLRSTYIGIPPESELKRAELDALARRLRGITKSISRYPTYRRRFECIMKTILEELGKKNGGSQSSNGHRSIQRSRSSFLHNLSQKSFNCKQSSSGSDKESNHVFERHMDIQ